jgi:hypothetical protein
MKKKNTAIPAVSRLNLLWQIGSFAREYLVSRLARATGAQDKAHTFSPWSHLLALLYAQPVQPLPGAGRKRFCQGDELRMEIEAQNKPRPLLAPPIQLCGVGEIGVAAHRDPA